MAKYVSTPMPTEPVLTIGSPRTKAAMRVLGILPKDMQPKDRTEFTLPDPGRKGKTIDLTDFQWEVRQEAFETKRRQLMHSVYGMATDKSLDLSHSANAVDPGSPSAGTNKFLADVMEREVKSMQKMEDRAKADVQKIVIEEMAAKDQVQIRAQKLEEHRLRMVTLRKAKLEKAKEDKKIAEKKAEKGKEVRDRAALKVIEEANKLKEEIEAKDRKVQEQIDMREEGWIKNREDKNLAREENYDRIAKFMAEGMGVREKMWDGLVLKTSSSEVRLADYNAELASHQSAKSDRTDGVIAKAKAFLGEAQAIKDEAFLKRIKEHDHAEKIRKDLAKETQKEYALANKKAKQTFEKSNEVLQRELEKGVQPSARMTKSMSESFTTSPAWCTEGSIKAFETHKTMGELRKLNLQLLRRAHLHQQSQALDKIVDIRGRVKALKDSKDEAQFRRFDMIKNVSIKKHHLTFQVEKIRDAPPEKMNSLLQKMGMETVRRPGDPVEEDAGEKKH